VSFGEKIRRRRSEKSMPKEAYPEPPARAKPLAHSLAHGTERILIAVAAALLLVPCFWQPHIIAGDLPSHIYNAWLAVQIEEGKFPAQLTLAHPVTNVLADLVTEGLLCRLGPSAAERIITGAAVELFFWGAFYFVAAAAGQRCWIIAPSLAMIAYGLIFHLGFLNFYISTGLSLWVMALLWRPRLPWCWLVVPVAVLAFLAHALPLAWALAALLYVHAVRMVPRPQRVLVFLGTAALMILAQFALLARFPVNRRSLGDLVSLQAALELTGTGQVWLYGPGYAITVVGILIVWLALFLQRLDRRSFLDDPVVHIWGLSALAYALMPPVIVLPQYNAPLGFMHARISLFIVILLCAVVSGGAHGRSLTRFSGLLASLFFTLMYLDARSLNRVEADLAGLLSNLPPNSRVAAALLDSASWRLNGLQHVGAAACLGRCFDYGNYEPASGQFRVRVTGPNDVVTDDGRIVDEIESARHIVTPQEAPLYTVCRPEQGSAIFELRKLGAGEITCLVKVPATQPF
jgi:hypothetical protein